MQIPQSQSLPRITYYLLYVYPTLGFILSAEEEGGKGGEVKKTKKRGTY